jgi:hypothetical protein
MINNQLYEFKKLHFLHLNPNFKQKKEISTIYCYNFLFNAEIDSRGNEEFIKYFKVDFA